MNEQKMRDEFEVDAKAYGFDVKRYSTLCTTGEPWIDYDSVETGHRWGGWLAACASKQEEINELQAKLDALMLEYCPEDMTGSQSEEWEKRQQPVEPEEVYSPNTLVIGDKCRKCAGQMQVGYAIAQTFTGKPDFIGLDEVVTVSPGGSGKMIECQKCSECGWSTT